jgi:lipopolysaccharide export system permease protein
MGRILKLHLQKEVAFTFLIGMLMFTSVLFINRILQLMELVVNKGVAFSEIGMLFLTILPSFLKFTLPMSFLMAILVTMGRMTSDNEVLACKAAGISLSQMLRPVFTLAVIIFVFQLFLGVYLIPRSEEAFSNRFFKLATHRAGIGLKEHVFLDNFHGMMIYLGCIDYQTNSFSRVLIADEQGEDFPRIIFASKGNIEKDEAGDNLVLHLKDGVIHKKSEKAYQMASFGNYQLNLDLAAGQFRVKDAVRPENRMTFIELYRGLQAMTARGENYFPFKLEMHKRLSLPVATLIFCLIGLSLGAMPQLSSKSGGFAFSLLIFILYYSIYAIGEDLGRSGQAPPWLMAWLPDVIFGILGIYLFYLATHERVPLPLVWGAQLRHRFRKKLNPSLSRDSDIDKDKP